MGAIYNLKHGHSGYERSRLYNTWLNIKQRCLNPNNPRYQHYGGKGVKIHQDWIDDFMAFKKWAMENGYKDHLTIDRIDVNGDYNPSNCRWISNKKQQNNRTNNRLITFRGETKTLKEWSEKTGLKYQTLQKRLNKGWTVEEALTLPTQPNTGVSRHETKSAGILK